MEAPARGALMLVRFIGLALISWAVVELALYWAICQHDQRPVEILPGLTKSLPLLAGGIVLVKAKSLAEWIANLLDN